MPRNQRHVDRAEKEKTIVDAAYTLFLQEGYENSSMSKIAQRAQIASNTIYWYFKDKDDVLVAVLNRELLLRIQQYQTMQATDMRSRLKWVIEQLQSLSRLVSTVHARIEHSATLNVWHDQFHLLTKQLLFSELNDADTQRPQVEALLQIWTFSIEGLLTHQVTEALNDQIIDLLVQQLHLLPQQNSQWRNKKSDQSCPKQRNKHKILQLQLFIDAVNQAVFNKAFLDRCNNIQQLQITQKYTAASNDATNNNVRFNHARLIFMYWHDKLCRVKLA